MLHVLGICFEVSVEGKRLNRVSAVEEPFNKTDGSLDLIGRLRRTKIGNAR